MSLEQSSSDSYNLARFVDAQESTYERARAELAAGEKRSHWMWFIFPQIRGLGSSPMAQRFAIADLKEAAAYLEHPLLGPRLRECTSLVNAATGRTLEDIFGYPDDLKFHSSVTLFAKAAAEFGSAYGVFDEAIEQWFGGKMDGGTVERLG